MLQALLEKLEFNVVKVIFVFCGDCKVTSVRVSKCEGEQGFMEFLFTYTVNFEGDER